MALDTGCVVVCRPKRSRSRPFTAAKLAYLARKVCEREGKDAVEAAVKRGLGDCTGEGFTAPCDLLDAAIHAVEVWNENVGPVVDWVVWAADQVGWLLELAAKYKLKIEEPPDKDRMMGALELIDDLRSGRVVEWLQQAKTRSGCPKTGGGF